MARQRPKKSFKETTLLLILLWLHKAPLLLVNLDFSWIYFPSMSQTMIITRKYLLFPKPLGSTGKGSELWNAWAVILKQMTGRTLMEAVTRMELRLVTWLLSSRGCGGNSLMQTSVSTCHWGLHTQPAGSHRKFSSILPQRINYLASSLPALKRWPHQSAFNCLHLQTALEPSSENCTQKDDPDSSVLPSVSKIDTHDWVPHFTREQTERQVSVRCGCSHRYNLCT